MMGRSVNRWIVAGAALGMALPACNELLDNDPRTWDPDAGEGGGAPVGGGAAEAGKGGAGKGGAGGKGGASSGRGGSTSGGGGTASGGRGGMMTAEAGASGVVLGGGQAGIAGEGEAGIAGEGGADPTSGAGGVPACECTPGASETNVEPCGDCMTGSRSQVKTCSEDCTWSPFGEFGECMGVTALCSPGTPGSQNVACPCGGTKSQSRSCTATCEWTGWTDTSSCDLECCSEIVFCNTPDDVSPASRGTWCRETQTACTNEEVNADCHVDIQEVCGSLVPDLYIQYL